MRLTQKTLKALSRVGGVVLGIALGAVLLVFFFTLDLSLNLSVLLVVGMALTISFTLAAGLAFWWIQKVKKMHGGMFDFETHYSVDVTGENRVPPPVLRPGIRALNELGFRSLGEEATFMGNDQELGCTWIFISEDKQIAAELVPVRAQLGGFMVSFSSVFPDYAWLFTLFPSGFPQGETIMLPDLRVRHTQLSLKDAYALHITELADFVQQHGTPIEQHTIADRLALEPIFRERHARMYLRRGNLLFKLQPYIWSGSALLFLIGTLVSGVAPALAVMIFVFGLSAVGLFFSYLIPVHPRAARWFRLGTVLALVLLPLSLMWPPFVAVHLLVLALLLVAFTSYIPAEQKALFDELQSDDVDWQGTRTKIDASTEEV
jgi:hypothetical protein